MAAAGHEFFTPSYTGLGERAHLASPDNDLDTHIQDVLGVLKFEDLRDVVLIGHSYGGMVATGVADRAPERIAQIVYLDAFVPEDGQALADFLPEGRAPSANRRRSKLAAAGWSLQILSHPTRPRKMQHGSNDSACRSLSNASNSQFVCTTN